MNFEEVYNIDVNKHVSKKGRFNYLSWAYAWKEFCLIFPTATYKILKDENNNSYFGNKEVGYMVYTTVTVGDLTHEMWLPVMDHNNKAIKTPDMMAINKAIMRCLVKNLGMFGLGLYIYAGEDLPNPDDTPPPKAEQNVTTKSATVKHTCADCGTSVKETVVKYSNDRFKKTLCFDCQKKQ